MLENKNLFYHWLFAHRLKQRLVKKLSIMIIYRQICSIVAIIFFVSTYSYPGLFKNSTREFVLNLGGWPSPTLVSFEAGYGIQFKQFNETRLALTASYLDSRDTSDQNFFLGFTLGERLYFPNSLSPLIGFAGTVYFDVRSRVASSGQETFKTRFAGAFYPEVGIIYWIEKKFGLTLVGRYYITVPSEFKNCWAINGGLTIRL